MVAAGGWLTQEGAVTEPAAGLALEQARGSTRTPYLLDTPCVQSIVLGSVKKHKRIRRPCAALTALRSHRRLRPDSPVRAVKADGDL